MAEPIGECVCTRSLYIRHIMEDGAELWFCDGCGRIWIIDPLEGLTEVHFP